MKVVEVPVPLIYLEEERSFGGSLDDGGKRLAYYHEVIDRAIEAVRRQRRAQHIRSAGRVRAECPSTPVDDCCPYFPC
jgi:hypothetical protein